MIHPLQKTLFLYANNWTTIGGIFYKQKLGKHLGITAPGLYLLDFGCLWDTLQVLLELQDFGIFLLQDGDQIVQQSNVSANTQQNVSNVQYRTFRYEYPHEISSL